MILPVIRIVITFFAAFLLGKAVSKLKLPSILGWLIAGMALGPHGVKLLGSGLLSSAPYTAVNHIFECTVGLMIGTELVWKRIRKSGRSIIITTLTQSLGTFLVVSAVFSVVFYLYGIPLYMAFIFGSIALATAPAPALSIVKEFKTSGPVTSTLIPMAALDDMVGVVVFFTTISVVSSMVSEQSMPFYMIPVVMLFPLVIGALTGVPAGLLLRKDRSVSATLTILISMVLLTTVLGALCNALIMPEPVLNFMLMGMSFSAVFANMMPEDRLSEIMYEFGPFLGVSIILVILNLGAPLDYHLIMGAGLFTAVYIISRAFGKYFGAWFGAAVTHSPSTVKKYLGLTLLPHSGVSLVFTGISAAALSAAAPENAQIIQGTIAAAAVINEIIAVVAAKKGFEWAGELGAGELDESKGPVLSSPVQHTA